MGGKYMTSGINPLMESRFCEFEHLKIDERHEQFTELLNANDEIGVRNLLADTLPILTEATNGRHYLGISEFQFGEKYTADFLLLSSINGPVLIMVKLGHPKDILFTDTGDTTNTLNDVLSQVEEWMIWFRENPSFLRQNFSCQEFYECDYSSPRIKTLIITGSRGKMSRRDIGLLQEMNTRYERLILTYDALIESTIRLTRFRPGVRLQGKAYSHKEMMQLCDTIGFQNIMKYHIQQWYGEDADNFLPWLRG
jgi:hypothetical protein